MLVNSRNKLFQCGSNTEVRPALDADNRNAPTGGKHSQCNPLPQSHVSWKSCRFHTLVCLPSPQLYACPPAGTSRESARRRLTSKIAPRPRLQRHPTAEGRRYQSAFHSPPTLVIMTFLPYPRWNRRSKTRSKATSSSETSFLDRKSTRL